MGRNSEKDAIEMASKNQRILEKGFQIFAEKTIDKVTMTDVAKAADIGIASLYRYYSTKQALVLAVATWAWNDYLNNRMKRLEEEDWNRKTAAEIIDYFLEAFLEMYRSHRDLLRFNQFFNVYLQNQNIPKEDMKPYSDIVTEVEESFGKAYNKGRMDGTLGTDIPEKQMFSTAIHLMLAAVTRYAVGLVYSNADTDAESELRMQKEMLLRQFCRG